MKYYVLDYIRKFGSFNSNGVDMSSKFVNDLCKKALEENREIRDEELYEEPDALL